MPPTFSVNSGLPSDLFPSLLLLWTVGVWVLIAIINISLAVAVLSDSDKMLKWQRRGTFLVGGGLWALIVLLGGVVAAGIYWVIHHSTLRPPPPAEPPSDEPWV